MASVAQNEASMISLRTKAALQAAKVRGVVLGGDRGGVIAAQAHKGAAASAVRRIAMAKRRAADLVPVIRAIRAEGATSLRKTAAVLNDRGILASRGGRWSAAKFFKFYGLSKEPSWHSLIRNWLMYIRLARRLCR